MKTIAIMPIKLSNERLPGKNTMLLGDKPLLQHELVTLRKTGLADEIYVYCSDEAVCPYLPEGVKFLKRPAELDLPTSNFTQIFAAFSSAVEADIYVYVHATAPFITGETMAECIRAVQGGAYDSAFCAVKIQDFLWKDGEPLNFDAANVPRSQDLEPIYRETSGVYVFTKEVFARYRRRIGKKPFVKEVSFKEAVDINNPEDFRLAEAMVGLDL
ncbi:acylneuraminate cytidylyltransferase family protein [Dysosmobacter sp. Sow4_B12]|uniref:acylneuraminate cytidylyltransferase family protein n=1 Tax=Dysosmobacter sp. Sow4_B12 TaxID=3438777 RepID=UPI003F92DECA